MQRLMDGLDRAEAVARRHRALFAQARDGMAILDASSLQLHRVNESFCSMADRPASELESLKFTDLFSRNDEQPTVSELVGAAKDGRNCTVSLARQDGTGALAEVSVSAIGAEDHPQLLIVLRDVSSRRNLQAELQRHVRALRERERTLSLVNRELADRTANMEEMNYRLQQLQKTKDHFLSAVSHELRTPLTSIRSFSEILLKHGETEPAIRQEFLEIINKESERLTRLVNNVLDLARIEAGELRLVLDDFDIGKVVEDAIGAVFGMAAERSISLKPDYAEGPHAVYADRDKIQQLAVNLLSNAIKFSPDDGQIDVIIGSGSEAGHIRVGVRDRGAGIHPDDLTAVFDKFRQVGEPGKRKPGSGLGLTICREIVNAHGGHIWVDSDVGDGSTFWFELPGAEESKRAFAARGARSGKTGEIRRPTRPLRQMEEEKPVSQPVLVEEILAKPQAAHDPTVQPETIGMQPLPPIGRNP
jgi:PAS domain S-box-containing protein